MTTLRYGGSASDTLEQVYNADRAEYNSVYRPINREMIDSVGDTDMVDSAKQYSGQNTAATQARGRRMQERFGMNLNSLEQNETQHRNNASNGLNYDTSVNTARRSQYERNNKVRDDMIAVGRGIDNQAYDMLNQAAGMESQREAANAAAKGQADAQSASMQGSIASAGMMAGYMVGGAPGIAIGVVSGLFGLF